MKTKIPALVAALALTVAFVGCSSGPDTPPQEDLEVQLRKEAEAIKAQNEGQDSDIGVKATWQIAAVEVEEQPGNETAPWKGKITFKIRSETSDMGEVRVDEFEKEFPYVYNPTLKKWIYSSK